MTLPVPFMCGFMRGRRRQPESLDQQYSSLDHRYDFPCHLVQWCQGILYNKEQFIYHIKSVVNNRAESYIYVVQTYQ